MNQNKKFAIYSKKILTESGFQSGYLIIDNEKIKNISVEKPNCNIEQADNLVVMPGIVDTHVHINEPGRTDWEGFETATKAACAGGSTTLVDMPLNCLPVTTTKDHLQVKLNEVKHKMQVDCAFWGGATPDNIDDLEELLDSGVKGVKVFLIHSGIDEFPNVNENDLRKIMPIMKKHNLPLLVHAELELNDETSNVGDDPTKYQNFLNSRPNSLEDNAIELMIKLCREYMCKVHIVHLSSASALEMIKNAKEEGLPISVETCPHYLALSAEDVEDGDTRYKCCPPIREKANNEKLWDGLKDGTIDFIVSDHSPCTGNLKLLDKGDIEKAWGGISGLQFSFSIVWTEAKERGFSVTDIYELMSLRTANFIGLGNKKGKIAEGYDADIVIWDPEEKFTISENIVQHKNKITPYKDKEYFGVIKKTYVRGNKVYDNGEFTSDPIGKFLL